MAINRFQNKDILVSSKVPVENVQTYSLTDSSNLSIENHYLTSTDLASGVSSLESHIYSADSLVHSDEKNLVVQLNTTDADTNLDFLIQPEKDIRLGVSEDGYYSICYNFVKTLSSPLRIINVSADGTELELEVSEDNDVLTGLYNQSISNESKTTELNLGLNFGNNKISTITDLSFYNNPRVGEQLVTVLHPTDTYNSEATFFSPSNEGKEDNQWVEFYSAKKPNNYGYSVYKNTGRSGKFNLETNSSGNAYYQIELDASGNGEYYTETNTAEDRQYPLWEGEYYNSPPRNYSTRRTSVIRRFSKVRYYNPDFVDTNNLKTVCVKLYKPLEDGLQPLNCRIDEILRESYIERLLVYKSDVIGEQPYFSSPNFKIDSGNYGKSQGTDLKSWNDLLDTNLTTSQQIIDKYISGSFGGVNLNIDYTQFNAFVKYSSAVERVNNYKYKLSLVESFDARVKTLESVSGSEALTNISQSIVRKDNVVSGMDGWERWMYTETSGSLYTHYSSSVYPLEPWPKSSTYPNINYSVTSSQGIAHYNGLIDSASIHDALNDARLTKVVPSAITEDPLNKEYVLFIDMIGHHFDITWSYVNALTSVNEREEHPYDGMPNDLLYDVAKSMGWKLTHGKDTSNLWEFGLGTDKFGNTPNSGSLPSKPHEQINNEIWRRIVNNIPYLLKTKGSARAVKALIATYGIPQTFLSIREYGGPVIDTAVRPMWEHDRFVYHLRMDADNYITVPWDKISDINPITYDIDTNLPGDGSTITKVVTTAGGKYVIDGVTTPSLVLASGNTYKFTQSSGTNSSHPLQFATAADAAGSTEYTTGVTIVGTAGSVGSYTQIVVTNATPLKLYYYCPNHSGYGGSFTINKGGPNPIDVIELQVQQNMNRDTAVIRKGGDFAVLYESVGTDVTLSNGNIHFYLSGSSGYKSASILDVPLFDSNMGTLLIERENSVNDITADNVYKLQYRKNRKDRISTSKSASIVINGSSESTYNKTWIDAGTVEFGKAFGTVSGAPSLWADTNTMSGSIQEIRYWAEQLKDIVIDEHTLSRESYHGNAVTSSYFDLKFRFIPDSNLKTITNPDSHASSHPNQKITGSVNGSHLTASLFNFENDDLIGVTEEYYTKVPSAGANNIMNNKVRTEENSLTGILDPDQKKEKSQYDSAPVDSNVVGVYLAATRMYNEDIYNHTGYFDIDDYIGNPDSRAGYTEQNEELDYIRRQVFKKYSSKNLINSTIDILAKYDMSVFEQIRQTMPARVDYNSGILIEPHILERPKVKSLTKVTQTRPMYDVTIAAIDRPVTASHHSLETEITNSYSLSAENKQFETVLSQSIYTLTSERSDYNTTIDTSATRVITSQKDDVEDLGNPKVGDMYASSQYRYLILNYSSSADVGYGINWSTGSNGYWNYDVVAKNISEHRNAKYAQRKSLFYSTSESASLGLPNSSSLHPSQVTTDELPLSVANLRFLGCKMKSDSLTTNSPDTPDGKPVIEIFKADPNVLIYTSQTGDEGNLDVDSGTGIATLEITDLVVNDDLYWKRLQEYRREVREFRRKLERIIQIETERSKKAHYREQLELERREVELERRKEFSIKNNFKG